MCLAPVLLIDVWRTALYCWAKGAATAVTVPSMYDCSIGVFRHLATMNAPKGKGSLHSYFKVQGERGPLVTVALPYDHDLRPGLSDMFGQAPRPCGYSLW